MGGKKEDLIKRLGIDVSSPLWVIYLINRLGIDVSSPLWVISGAGDTEDAVLGGKKEDPIKRLGIDASFPTAATGAGDNEDAAVGGTGPCDKADASPHSHKLPLASKDFDDGPRRAPSGDGDEFPIIGKAPKNAVKSTLWTDVGRKKEAVWAANKNKDVHTIKTREKIERSNENPHVDHIVEMQVSTYPAIMRWVSLIIVRPHLSFSYRSSTTRGSRLSKSFRQT